MLTGAIAKVVACSHVLHKSVNLRLPVRGLQLQCCEKFAHVFPDAALAARLHVTVQFDLQDGYVDEDDLERLVASISKGHSEGTAQHLREVFETGWTRVCTSAWNVM